MRSVVLAGCAVGCAALLLAACGGEQHPSTVDPKVREALVAGVNRVDSAARQRDRTRAEVALAGLTRDIATHQARGQLDPETAQKMLAAADRVAEDVRTLPQPAPPTPPTVVIQMPPPTSGTPAASQQQPPPPRHRPSALASPPLEVPHPPAAVPAAPEAYSKGSKGRHAESGNAQGENNNEQ